MSEIEIGEYVKLDNGKIGKVIAIEKGSIMLDIVSNRWVGLCCITKHSKNIIDLIEEGDYVNGYKVVETYKNNELKGWQIGKEKEEIWLGVIVNSKMIKEPLQEYFDNNMIKTIVTKEQFNSVMYKVGEINENNNYIIRHYRN